MLRDLVILAALAVAAFVVGSLLGAITFFAIH